MSLLNAYLAGLGASECKSRVAEVLGVGGSIEFLKDQGKYRGMRKISEVD